MPQKTTREKEIVKEVKEKILEEEKKVQEEELFYTKELTNEDLKRIRR